MTKPIRPNVHGEARRTMLWLCEMVGDFMDDPNGKERKLDRTEHRRILSAMLALQSYAEDGFPELQKPVANMMAVLGDKELATATRHDIAMTLFESVGQLKAALESAINEGA